VNRKQNELAGQFKGSIPTEEQRTLGKELKETGRDLQTKFESADKEWHDLLLLFPVMASDSTPVGISEAYNVVLREVGEKPNFNFQPKDHYELAKNLGLLDFEAGAKVSGSQFYFTKGDLVMLEFALLQFGLELLRSKGFEVFITPDLAKSKYYLGTGYMPKGDEAQIYEIEGDDLGLIATAEITMAGYHADELFTENDLPKKYAAISHCYRREAGAYGKYSKGLYRVHQFTKLEMFSYITPESSTDMHAEILGIEEEIANALGIPYRVLQMLHCRSRCYGSR
jgi:seryl-tRNA synthetase